MLKAKVMDKVEKYQMNGFSKIHLEAKFTVKQAQIVNAFLLEEADEGLKKKSLTLKDSGTNRPEDQAAIQQSLFGDHSRSIQEFD